MQAKVRYLALSLAVLAALILWASVFSNARLSRQRTKHGTKRSNVNRPSSLDVETLYEENYFVSSTDHNTFYKQQNNAEACTMETCFNLTKCVHGFKVYIYDEDTDMRISSKYREILDAIRRSKFHTQNASEACLFVLGIDTLDRDKLSGDFVHNIDEKLQDLKLWNNGENHIIFNLYSGTWPDYSAQELGFDYGKAIVAKASLPLKHYRQGFDISLPLFHKEHPFIGGEPGYLTSNNVPPVRQYTLSFKGKRYLHGIGSESRNALYHIHNGKDIILLTTCKHVNTPKRLYDERCDRDDQEYEK